MAPDATARADTSNRPTDARDAVVVARGLTKRYGDFVAVDGIDLTIQRGTCFGLLGPNGAGKTTAIKTIQCVSPLTEGTLHVLGMDTRTERRHIKRLLGLVPQEDNLDPDFTVFKNLTTYARFFRIPRRTAHERADRLLHFVQLQEKRDAHIQQLSGGMKRRLVVARSLVNDPQLLILDEPTTGLDPQARHTIWDKIRALKREGKTVLLTTHYMDEAEMLCDRLVIIDKGRILEEGAPRELIRKHVGGQAMELVAGAERPETLDALAADLDARGVTYERLSDRLLAFGPNLNEIENELRTKHGLTETIERRATLEDVFLRLTGRALRD
ncbi:MAG: ABC transporter ATP-binding protein [Euryarchaeota archaeon]|nr:ABC transporter ATP-binding protein [Euryarchaeota archaeon]